MNEVQIKRMGGESKGDPKPGEPGQVVGKSWNLYTQWFRESEDAGKEFQQRVRFLKDESTVFFDGIGSFRMLKPFHRMVAEVDFFPVVPDGWYKFELYLREAGREDDEWNLISEYPLFVGADAEEYERKEKS